MTIKLLKDVKDYTHSDLRVAEFIEESGEEVLFMSIGQVAERLNLSEATVSRSVRHLGFSDFKELNDFLEDNEDSVIVKYEVAPDRQLALVWTSDDADVFEAFHRKYSD